MHTKFTFEGEIHGTLAFLNVSVNREKYGFTTSVYRKKTFTRHGMIFLVVISCFIHSDKRAFKISSNYTLFHIEIPF